MRTVAMLIVLALLSATAVGQTLVVSKDVSKIRQFVASQPIGQKLHVYMKTGPYRLGNLAKTDAESFEIKVGNRTEKIAYSMVAGVARVQDTVPEKKTFWKHVGQGLQTAFGVAAIGTFLVVTYPVAKLAERRADTKAKALEKEIATALPRGTGKSEVIAFLDSRKIAHEEVRISKSVWLIFLNSTFGSPILENANQIHGSIRCGSGYYINLTFRFDDADRLIDSKVDIIVDSL